MKAGEITFWKISDCKIEAAAESVQLSIAC